MEHCLELIDIGKKYYGNQVLKNVTLKVKPGEIVSLVGENGAGKSTLMNILFGMPVIHATGGHDGEIRFDGQPVSISSPADAMRLGIGMVHQEFMLIPGFTVTENIKLNRETTKPTLSSRLIGPSFRLLDLESMRADARRSLDEIGLSLDECAKVAGLPVGYMQFIEIAREIDKKNIRLLVLDEPTAVLTESEAQELLKAMRRLSEKGIAMLFISHRLEEVMQISDSIMVLRDGEMVTLTKPADTSVDDLAEAMVGRRIDSSAMHGRPESDWSADNALEIRSLKVSMPGEAVRDFSFSVKKGEILGLGGLAGQGKIGVANGVMGLYPATGEVRKDDSPLPLNRPAEALARDIAFVSEDRRGVGLLLDDSIGLNIVSTALQLHGRFMKGSWLRQIDDAAVTAYANDMIREYDIRCTGPEQLTRRLSGGNQQKVCIARAITQTPDLLFVSEPTRGIDIGAKKRILDALVKLNRDHGMTIVVTSSELAELRAICDRIAIVYEGKLAGVLLPTDSDRDFGLMMAGKQRKTAQPAKEPAHA